MAKIFMRDPTTASSRIYVGSLSEQATETQLDDLFSKYGPIRGIMISKGYGFVQFETDDSAQNAIQNENQQMFLNRRLIVRTVQKNPEKHSMGGGAGGGSSSNVGGSNVGGSTAGGGNLASGGSGSGNNDGGNRANNNLNKSGNDLRNNSANASTSMLGNIPMFGGGSQPPSMSRWGPSNKMRNQNDKPNDNGRERSPLGDHRGGGEHGGGGGGGFGRPFQNDRFRMGHRDQPSLGAAPQRPLIPPTQAQQLPPPTQQIDANDCEIVVTAKHLTEYAEAIERNLKQMGLSVDLLFPNSDVPIGKVLHSISSRGCLYAIIVTQENLDRRSITVNILYGQPEEHRNMPAEDALDFIEKDYNALRRGRDDCDKNIPFHALKTQSVPSQGFKHPDSIQYLLTLLYETRSLTVLQYDCVIKYLQDQREIQYKIELGGPSGDFSSSDFGHSSSKFSASTSFSGNNRSVEIEKRNVEAETEAELQKKILNILNKPPITDFGNSSQQSRSLVSSQYNNDADFNKNDSQPQILNDPKVQKALDSLFSNSHSLNF